MPGHRAQRIAELVHRELAERLRLEVKDPRVGPISVTHVEVTRDLSRATAHYMPLGGGAASAELRDGLLEAAKQLRGPIGRALKLRHAPELVFVLDEHTDRAIRVSSLIEKVARELPAAAPAAVVADADNSGEDS